MQPAQRVLRHKHLLSLQRLLQMLSGLLQCQQAVAQLLAWTAAELW